jgi:hypothetical protein
VNPGSVTPDVPMVGAIVEVLDTPDTRDLAGELAVVARMGCTPELGVWWVQLRPWLGQWDVDAVTLLARDVMTVAEPAGADGVHR